MRSRASFSPIATSQGHHTRATNDFAGLTLCPIPDLTVQKGAVDISHCRHWHFSFLTSHFSYSDIDYSHFSDSDIDAALSADIDSILDWHQHGLLPLFHAPWPYSQQNPPPWLFPIHSHCVWCRWLDILRHAPDLPQSQEKAITTSVLGYKRDANPRKN